MVTTLTERVYASDWLKGDVYAHYNRDRVILQGGQGILKSCALLGAVTEGGALLGTLDATAAGNGTIAAAYAAGGQPLPGTYRLLFTSASKYEVENVAGKNLGEGTVGTPSTIGGITYTVTAGGTPFAAGDTAGVTTYQQAGVAALGNTGNGTINANPSGAIVPGTYTVKFTSPTAYTVTDPTGAALGAGTVGAAAGVGPITVLAQAGGTAFVANDSFTVVLTATGRRKLWDPTATDGSEVLAGVLMDQTDTSNGDVKVASLERGPATMTIAFVSAGAGYTGTPAQVAQLKSALGLLGIKVIQAA